MCIRDRGTVVAPSSGGQYIAVNDGFEITGNRETLESAELKDSLGKGAPVSGSEAPSVSIPFYLRHSGVEGTAPMMDEIYTAAFGAESIEDTEYNTVASSTVSVVKLDSGEGANKERGEALLIKDPVNGYSIRPIASISGDDLTVWPNLSAAPGTGVNVGKAVLYKPADSGHQSLSLWSYHGDSDLTQLVSGCRVTSLDITANAEEPIEVSATLEGLKLHRNPLTTTSSLKYIDFTDDQGTVAVSVSEKTWKHPHELAAAVESAMNAATSETITCTYSNTTGKFTIASSTSSVLSLLWDSGSNAANTIGTVLGFSVAADDTGSTSYEGDNAITLANPQTPSLDSSDFLVAKNISLAIGRSGEDNGCVGASAFSFSLATPKTNIKSLCAETGISSSVINERSSTFEVTTIVNKYDVERFRNFSENETVSLLLNFGEKSGGNWVAGKAGCIYAPNCKLSSSPDIQDLDGSLAITFSLETFVDADNNGEIYLNFV